MYYISERITNIAELEHLTQGAYILAQHAYLMTKEKEPPIEQIRDSLENIVSLCEKIDSFEFLIERRKTTTEYLGF